MKARWQSRKLGELCSIELGKTPSRSSKAFWDESRETNNVWLSIADLLNAEDGLVSDSKEYLSDAGAALCKTVRAGTLLVSFKLTLGRMAFAGRDLFTNEAIAALGIFNEAELSKEFLFYFFHFFDWRKAAENDVKLKGMTLNKAKLKEIVVSFPEPDEQKRIVAFLNEAFAGIANARAAAEQNRQNARALFESHLQSVFSQRGEGWVEMPFGELATFRNGINFTKSSRGQSIRILGVKNFQNNFWAPLNELETVIPDGMLSDSDTLEENDLLFVRSNGNPELIGRCLLIGAVSERITYSGFTIRARLNTSNVVPQYLCHFLKSNKARREMIDGGNGANIKSLNQGTLSRLFIPFPNASSQIAIVEQLEAMQEETQRLEAIYQRKLEALDELKQSLLHQAFSGQL